MFLILLLYMLFAVTFTLGKGALDYASPIFFIGFRMSIAGLLLLGYVYLFNRKNWRLEFKHLWILFQMMIFHVALTFICEFWSLQYVSASKTALLFNLSPFFTALFAYIFFAEALTKKKWLGLIVGFVGFMPTLMSKAPEEAVAGSIGFFSFPELVLFISVVSSCYGWILMQKMVSHEKHSPLMINGIAMLGGGLMCLGVSRLVEGPYAIASVPRFGTHITPFDAWLTQWIHADYSGIFLFLFYTAALIIIANFICYNLYGWLLSHYSATFVSFAGFTTPLFAALFAWLFRGETTNWEFFASCLFVFIGLYIFYQEELKRESITFRE